MERAAALVYVPLSSFVLEAARLRADEVLREHDRYTVVPESFFDDLLDALDHPPVVNQPLARASERARTVLVQH